MEKKYNFEKREPSKVEEPAVTYQPVSSEPGIEKLIPQNINRPCLFTDEEKLQQLKQGVEDIQKEEYILHEEVLQTIKRHSS